MENKLVKVYFREWGLNINGLNNVMHALSAYNKIKAILFRLILGIFRKSRDNDFQLSNFISS